MSIVKIYQGHRLQLAFNEITSPVRVTYFALDQPEQDTLVALNDLLALTPHLSFTVKQTPIAEVDRVIVQGENNQELVFAGAPIGTELAALVSAIIVAGRGQSGLWSEMRQALVGLSKSVHLEVFTTPT